MKKKVLFIDRDGTLVIEPPIDYQLDSFEKLEFYPKVFRNLFFIRQKLDFDLNYVCEPGDFNVMIGSNSQDVSVLKFTVTE